MKAALLAAFLVATMPAAAADPAPAAIERYEYRPEAIHPVRTAHGITTRIELDPTDEVLDFSTGFSDGWDIQRRGSVFYLRPLAPDVDTNLQVRTEARSYIFELRVVASDWRTLEQVRRAGVQYRIAFGYPPGTEGGQARATRPGADAASSPLGQSIALVQGRHYHFGYEAAPRRGSAWLVPARVYDDGEVTYIRMHPLPGAPAATAPALPTGTFPAVFARRERDGEDFMVNASIEEGVLVVHGIHPFLVLRHGRAVVGLRRAAP